MGTEARRALTPMTEAIQEVDRAVQAAARALQLHDTRPGFDGESWTWAWRRINEQNLHQPVPESRVQARPDVFKEGLEISVVSLAWIPEKRITTAGRQYFGGFFRLPIDRRQLEAQIKEHLDTAWKDAHHIAERLPEIAKIQSETEEQLKSKGLLATSYE